MNKIIKEYLEERLHEMEDKTGLDFLYCCQFSSGTLHAFESGYGRERLSGQSRN